MAYYGDGSTLSGISDTGARDDIALLGFKVAANGSLARYNLVDQSVDAFETSAGIDLSTSTNEIYDAAGNYFSGFIAGNYFGDESDGALDTSGNVTYTVLNPTGDGYDGDMVLKQYTDLTVNAGHTITVNAKCRGMFIYVSGDLVLDGTIAMNGLGAKGDPSSAGGSDSAAVNSSGLQLALLSSGSETLSAPTFAGCGDAVVAAVANQPAVSGDGTIFSIAKIGGAGAAQRTDTGGYATGNTGTAGATSGTSALALTGGGGSGGASFGHGGAGGTATCFAGGSGGGGGQGKAGNAGTGGVGTAFAGAGGAGISVDAYSTRGAGGGAGIPGGAGANAGSAGGLGNGGIIWLVVKGDISGSGTISCDGVAGGAGGANQQAGGGGSGAGGCIVLCGGTDSQSWTNGSTGGAGGDSSGSIADGGVGGAGGLIINDTVSGGGTYNNITLVSNAYTAQAAPTKGDLVFTYTNGAGSAVVGTNLTADISMDDGSTWTSCGLGTADSQGTTGGHTIVTKNNISLTSTSGTNMRYRIKTLVQSESMDTRIQAVSLGWS